MTETGDADGSDRETVTSNRHPPVNDIRDLISFRLARLVAANDRVGQRWTLREFGLRLNEWRVLGLVHVLRPLQFADLAHALAMDKGQLSRVVKALAARGLVVTKHNPEDLRTAVLETTDTGGALHERMLSYAIKRNSRVIGMLEPHEIAELFRLIDKIGVAVDERLDQEN